MFEVGQEVVCFVRGDGVVAEIKDSETYRVRVRFINGSTGTYTVCGKLFTNQTTPSLYPRGTTFTVNEPEVIFEEGEIVEVRMNEDDKPRLRRYYKKDNTHFCYVEGNISVHKYREWDHVRKPQPFVKAE